jgi:hypothetical protein
MRVGHVLAALAMLLGSVGSASAQVLSLEFLDGKVRLIAENVPVSRILGEWSRVGRTTIVNGERVPGGPVTLQLIDVPERQAIDVVLRGAAGYMVAARRTGASGPSVFDRILVLPTTTRAPSAAPPLATAPPQLQDDDQLPVGDDLDQAQTPQPGIPPALQRGRAQPPGAVPPDALQQRLPLDGAPEADDPPPVTPGPGNPFGVAPGSTRPGVIAAPPRRNPDDQPQ